MEAAVPMPGCRTVADVLSTLATGGEWRHRFVTLRFTERPQAWFLPMSVGKSSPYFDFGYTNEQPPEVPLAAVLQRYPGTTIIDWCPGTLACIMTEGADLRRLEQLIADVARVVHGATGLAVEASYEQMQPA